MERIARLIPTFLIALAMFSIAGGHWAVLQTIAWAQMVRDYSQTTSVAEAIEKTFSGEAPCSMCKSIAKARTQEQKAPATVKLDKKAEVFLLAPSALLCCPDTRDFTYPAPAPAAFAARADAPPVPVPIFLA